MWPSPPAAGAPSCSRASACRRADPTKPLVTVGLKRNGENLSLTFPFAYATPAAVFNRADTLWLVFDTDAAIDLGNLDSEPNRTIKTPQPRAKRATSPWCASARAATAGERQGRRGGLDHCDR
jgi:hypothetical protein